MSNELFEQPGQLYLGRETGAQGAPFFLPARHLTTHAALIGMTGSGKTGLGVALLEECALSGIPALIVDPKGDMSNLLLNFPDLSPAEFEPWMDADAAARENMSVQELAAQTANRWRQGLADWGQDGSRIRRLRESADFTVFTPGSAAGRPLSVLDSMDAPGPEVLADQDTLTGLVNAAVSSLLSLAGLDADPIKSREHVLLSTLVLHFWNQGEHVGLAGLIAAVAQPPVDRIGVFPVDSFYPENKRMDLAMQLNTLMASPSFASWMSGEPLHIGRLLVAEHGRPRHSIFSLAHLSDAERMFFVTLLLGRLIGWMRRQEGSEGLRALLYMDEIFGYFPPGSNPPSKEPMLLLLKQARAFGLGVVLATQNPVDLDYKGLANIGSWCIGRLQTRQDQERVVSGMAATDREGLRTLLASLEKRCFLLHSAHRNAPLLFQTRWTLSYLKGPIALTELAKLGVQPGTASPAPGPTEEESTSGFSATRPLIAGEVAQYFALPAAFPPLYRPTLLGLAQVRHTDQRRGIDQVSEIRLQASVPQAGATVSWEAAQPLDADLAEFLTEAPEAARFAALPAELTLVKAFEAAKKRLAEYLYRTGSLPLFRVQSLKLESAPGESEAEFRERLAGVLADKRAAAQEQLAQTYEKKRQQLQLKLERAQAKLDKEQRDVRVQGVDTIISLGTVVLGALFGRKGSVLGKSTQGMRDAGQLMKEKQDVQVAQGEVTRLSQELAALQAEEQARMQATEAEYKPEMLTVESFSIAPRKSDIYDLRVCLLWKTVQESADQS